VHVGNDKGKNYSTMFSKNMCQDFIFPVMINFQEKYGDRIASGGVKPEQVRIHKKKVNDLKNAYD